MAEKAVKNSGEKVGRWVKKLQKRQKVREEGRMEAFGFPPMVVCTGEISGGWDRGERTERIKGNLFRVYPQLLVNLLCGFWLWM
jgi:hypothetical protein